MRRPVRNRPVTNYRSLISTELCDRAKHAACTAESPVKTRVSLRCRFNSLPDRPSQASTAGRMLLHDDVDAVGGRMQAVGLIELRVAGDAFEKERIERHVVASWRGPDRSRRNARRSRRRNCAARTCRTGTPRSRAPSAASGSRPAPCACTAGSSPRSASLAPSSTITACVPSGIDQSSRSRPPEVVSPETPALIDVDVRSLVAQRLLQPHRERRRGRQAIAGGQGIAEDRRS